MSSANKYADGPVGPSIPRLETKSEDLYDLGEHVSVEFKDVFGEPESFKTTGIGKKVAPALEKYLSLEYSIVMTTMYYVLALITGVFLTLVWGLVFGIVHWAVVWVVQPVVKAAFVFVRVLTFPVRPLAKLLLDPVFDSLARVLGGIRGNFRLNLPELFHLRPRYAVPQFRHSTIGASPI